MRAISLSSSKKSLTSSLTSLLCLPWLALPALLPALGCGVDAGEPDGDPDPDPAPVFTDGDGFPELTGPLAVPATIAKGDTLIADVPVDADTAFVRLAVEDFATSTTLVQNDADESAPSSTFRGELAIPIGSSAPPGSYYLTVELCSSVICENPFKRVSYERVGDSDNYTRVDFDSPPLAQVGDARDSGVVITPFELQ